MKLRDALVWLGIAKQTVDNIVNAHPEIGITKYKLKNLESIITEDQYISLFKYSHTNLFEGESFSHYNSFNDSIITSSPNLDIEPQPVWDYQNKKIRIGMVIRCKKGETFGLICKKVRDGWQREIIFNNEGFVETKTLKKEDPIRIYYFRKDKSVNFTKYSLVTYILDSEEQFLANHILELSKYKEVGDCGKYILDNNRNYYDKNVWETMKEGIPFVSVSTTLCYYYPLSLNKTTITYCESVISEDLKLYYQSKYLRALSHIVFPTPEEIEDKKKSIKKYVNDLNIDKILHTYRVHYSGVFQSRVGRDDHFNMEIRREINTEDAYIKNLVPLEHELSYELATINDKYSNYDYDNIEESENIRKHARNIYTKEDHCKFLINDYLNTLSLIKDELEETIEEIEISFDIHTVLHKLSHFEITGDNFCEVVSAFNTEFKQHD